jgi:predicted 2-oxoglutarate/Fe(II)-dependent dioxygenase YbiX
MIQQVTTGVFTITDVLTPDECSHEMKKIQNILMSKVEVQPFVHVCDFFNQKTISPDDSKWLWNKIQNALVNDDEKTMMWNFDIHGVSKYITTACYNPGQQFGLHTDTGIIDESRQLESKCTALVYLNDNFEGGETVFYDDNFQETVTIYPKAGMALIFDINLWHKANTIVSGKKYWIGTELMTKSISDNEDVNKDKEENVNVDDILPPSLFDGTVTWKVV